MELHGHRKAAPCPSPDLAPDHRPEGNRWFRSIAATCLAALLGSAAQPCLAEGGRLLATSGATQVEGAAGGGLVPWALLNSYATDDEFGASAFATQVELPDFSLASWGLGLNLHNRVELSLAKQRLDLGTLGEALDLRDPYLTQTTFGLKLRLAGDAVYSSWPQIALGAQFKSHEDFGIPAAVGARDASGTDFTLSATKVFLAAAGGYHLLLNATLRSTEANQFGLLGFGGDQGGRHIVSEYSAAVLLDRSWAVGVEYRQKPDNLGFAREDDAADAFVAWFPNKHLAVVAAWVDLGSVAGYDDQRGAYLSLQVTP